MSKLTQHLKRLSACREAIDWAGERTAGDAWAECTRPDWLGWWLAKTNTEPDNRRLAKLYCRIWAEDLAPLLPEAERAPFADMLATVAAWCDEPTEDNREKALDRDRASDLALALALDLDRASALALDLDRASALALDRASALALDRDRASDLALALALALALDLDRASALALDLALALALALDLDRASARALALALDLDRASARALALALDLDRASDRDKKWCDAIRAEFECPLAKPVKS